MVADMHTGPIRLVPFCFLFVAFFVLFCFLFCFLRQHFFKTITKC